MSFSKITGQKRGKRRTPITLFWRVSEAKGRGGKRKKVMKVHGVDSNRESKVFFVSTCASSSTRDEDCYGRMVRKGEGRNGE